MNTKSRNHWRYGMKIMTGVLAAVAMTVIGAAPAALAEGAVKVECWGNCARVNLGQVCDKYIVNSLPVAIACDDTATPGSGWSSTCGNGATCTAYGVMLRSDYLSAYCADGGGNDAVVTCR